MERQEQVPFFDKVEILYILVGVTFFAPLSPSIFTKKLRTGGKLVSHLNCFASGVFAGIVFFHILPECYGKIDLLIEGVEMGLRTANLLFLCGFSLMLWLDRLWFSRYHHHNHHSHAPPVVRDNSEIMIEMDPQSQTVVEVDITSKKKKRMIAIGTLIAFSFHSFLEGIALGSETPDMEILGLIFIFSFHKALDGLAITIPLAKAHFQQRVHWGLIFGFCCMTPLGLFSAYSLIQYGPLVRYSGAIEAVSGGVFLYISLFHLLREEIESDDHKLTKLIAFTVAIFVIFGIEYVI